MKYAKSIYSLAVFFIFWFPSSDQKIHFLVLILVLALLGLFFGSLHYPVSHNFVKMTFKISVLQEKRKVITSSFEFQNADILECPSTCLPNAFQTTENYLVES